MLTSGGLPLAHHASMFRYLRVAFSSGTNFFPRQIRLLKEAKALAVEYNDGEILTIPAELLRIYSPAADSKKSEQKVLSGRRHVNIMRVEAVGNYAVRLQFDDLHGSGLFTWEALHDLGRRQEEHLQNYLELLEKQGLSRDPRRTRK